MATPATAVDYDTIATLNADGFADKLAAIDAVAASGGDNAAPVLQAFLDGNLYARKSDGRLIITQAVGRDLVLVDPLTLAEIGRAPKGDFSKVRTNNQLRAALRGAIGGLQLTSRDGTVRLAAASAVFKTRSPDMVPLLEAAIAAETDARILREMRGALAATVLETSLDADRQMAAIETLSEYPTPDVQALLGAVAGRTDSDPRVVAAAGAAYATIEGRLAMWENVANIFRGISLGSVLILAAVGLAITFGVMGVINMAHGELIMIGAYTTFVIQDLIRAQAPELFAYSLFLAVPAAFLVAGSVGIAIERYMIRFLYGRPLETLLATWGLSLILQQAVRSLFGPTNREVGTPDWMSGSFEIAAGVALTYNRLYIIIFSLIVVGLLALLMTRTSFGLQMRAVTQNRAMAASMGIRTGRIDALTFGLGAGIAGVAGVALSQIDNVSPNLGQSYIIDSFLVVVFGGVGNLWGTVVGALSLGLLNKFMEPFAGAVLAKILVLVAIILFIQKRPRGLFALKGRAVEA